jgi:hypothetical protein
MPFPEALDAADKLVKIAAIAVGGLWAYIKFFKGRTFHPRVEPSIIATIKRHEESPFLVVAVSVKNIGFTSFAFARDGLALRLFEARISGAPKPQRAIWRQLATMPVFQHHEWIESGETANDQVLIDLPANIDVIYKVEFRFLSERQIWKREPVFPWLARRRISWSLTTVARQE